MIPELTLDIPCLQETGQNIGNLVFVAVKGKHCAAYLQGKSTIKDNGHIEHTFSVKDYILLMCSSHVRNMYHYVASVRMHQVASEFLVCTQQCVLVFPITHSNHLIAWSGIG